MAISKFKFVSPGIFIDEIDKSKLPVAPEAMGPVIIGRSVRGPLMRPVKVPDYSTFVELFGEPHPGGEALDAWKNGNKTATTYAAYAAKAYLASGGPLTFLRLGGYANVNADPSSGLAGWTVSAPSTSSAGANGGAYGIYVAPISGAGDLYTMPATTGTLAAVIYTNGASPTLVGKPLSGSAEITAGGSWIRSTQTAFGEFKLKINDGVTTATPKTFNLSTTSKNYIRKVLNTDPSSLDTANGTDAKKYFLGETYIGSAIIPTGDSYAACLVALASAASPVTNHFGKHQLSAQYATSGWVVSQHKGAYDTFTADATTGEYADIEKLFKFASLTEGEWAQSNLKISISDIKPSTNPFTDFGTFTVSIRNIADSDVHQSPVEVFSGLSLDPASPNYIAKKIGDTYSEWDATLDRFVDYGKYANQSKHVRVVMHSRVEENKIANDCLPVGFYTPKAIKSLTVSGSNGLAASIPSSAVISTKFYGASVTATNAISASAAFTASLEMPKFPLTLDSAYSTVSSLEQLYWGFNTSVIQSNLYNADAAEFLRRAPSFIANPETDTTYLALPTLFTLDDVAYYNSAADVTAPVTGGVNYTNATWAVGQRASGKSITAKNLFSDAGLQASVGGFSSDAFQQVARFTVPLAGGFDGVNILKKEPFINNTLLDSATAVISYAYNTIDTAINMVSDPEVVEMNLVSIPGLQNETLTNKLLDVCASRGDALAVVDLKGDYVSEFEGTDTESARKPDVATAVRNLKDRQLNNSYGCAFFPAVVAKDTTKNALVSLPASIVALGTMASSAKKSELWFAPAGFNRGGLSDGAAGFPVVGVKARLTAKERDALYEVNINPIATFPAEGIVVFGQKTLQVTPSALDRINVRRLMIYVKKEVSRMATTVLFDPNTKVTWQRFLDKAVPFLNDVKGRFGLSDFKVVLDETTTTPDLVDRNVVYAKIFLKPTRAIEFVALDFIITGTGASFND